MPHIISLAVLGLLALGACAPRPTATVVEPLEPTSTQSDPARSVNPEPVVPSMTPDNPLRSRADDDADTAMPPGPVNP
jgi:hypothetical protein